MKWIKHDTDAHRDPKLRKLMMRYGLEGYGLYFYCLELIAAEVSQSKLTFELEHDAEIIAHDTRLSQKLVEDIMLYMVELGLFENIDGRITCFKLLSRIDTSQTSNPQFRQQIKALQNTSSHDPIMTASGRHHDPVMTESCIEVEVEVDKELVQIASNEATRTSSKAKPVKAELNIAFDQFWSIYPRKQGKAEAQKKWPKLSDSDREACMAFLVRQPYSATEPQFIPMGSTFVNQRRWEDELSLGDSRQAGGDYCL